MNDTVKYDILLSYLVCYNISIKYERKNIFG